jgi:ribosomal protein L37AE/L43A
MSSDELTCVKCGIAFAVPKDWLAERRHDGTYFYCPNGHPMAFRAERAKMQAELSRLKQSLAQRDDELKAEQQRARLARVEADEAWARAEDEEKRHAATKAKAKQAAKRVHAGVCPHCNRRFAGLARHMAMKHPAETKQLSADNGADGHA